MDDSKKRIRGAYFSSNKMRTMHLDFMRNSQLNRRRVPTQRLYREIISTLFGKIYKEIIFEGYEFVFGSLGKFLCVKYLPKTKQLADGKIITNKPVNFAETFKVRKETKDFTRLVYYDNSESGGYTYKILWDRTFSHFVNKTFFKLKMQKDNRLIFTEGILNRAVQAKTINVNL